MVYFFLIILAIVLIPIGLNTEEGRSKLGCIGLLSWIVALIISALFSLVIVFGAQSSGLRGSNFLISLAVVGSPWWLSGIWFIWHDSQQEKKGLKPVPEEPLSKSGYLKAIEGYKGKMETLLSNPAKAVEYSRRFQKRFNIGLKIVNLMLSLEDNWLDELRSKEGGQKHFWWSCVVGVDDFKVTSRDGANVAGHAKPGGDCELRHGAYIIKLSQRDRPYAVHGEYSTYWHSRIVTITYEGNVVYKASFDDHNDSVHVSDNIEMRVEVFKPSSWLFEITTLCNEYDKEERAFALEAMRRLDEARQKRVKNDLMA